MIWPTRHNSLPEIHFGLSWGITTHLGIWADRQGECSEFGWTWVSGYSSLALQWSTCGAVLKSSAGWSVASALSESTAGAQHISLAWPHAMHRHGHHFWIEQKGIILSQKRDTYLMDAGEQARLFFVADNSGSWLFHCHVLEHHVSGMSGVFRVTWKSDQEIKKIYHDKFWKINKIIQI